MISKSQMVKLLGRSLTETEDTNYDLYLKIATGRLENMLCMSICKDDGDRTYESRHGYRTLYIDPFVSIDSVTIDGEEVDEDDYIYKQNDNLNASWYNAIEFDTKRTGQKIEVSADWGFDSCPSDLQMLLAKLFNQGSIEQDSNNVQSKKIEDFSVTYKDSATFDQFVLNNKATIDKYSNCNQGAVRHGRVRPLYHY